MQSGITKGNKITFSQNQRELSIDDVLVEQPLQIRLLWQDNQLDPVEQSRVFSITMRTPSQDKALIVGLLLSEGIISAFADICEITQELDNDESSELAIKDNLWEVQLSLGIVPNLASLERYQVTYSSCGLCGTTSLKSLELKNPPLLSKDKKWLQLEHVYAVTNLMRAEQSLFSQTGSSHAAGLFNEHGELLFVSEDIGRHNALDKVLGARLIRHHQQIKNKSHNDIVVVSGRISFEIVQKTLMAGISVLIAVGAPSDLAIAAAKRFDLTLIGFASKTSFNLYHGEWRLAQ